MDVTLSGIVKEVKSVQPEKAAYPIDVTFGGIVIEVSPLQLSKAYSPTIFTLLGIIVLLQPCVRILEEVSIIALQLFLESYFKFSLSTFIEVRELQPEKAECPMDVTFWGIVMEVSPVQSLNAYWPMDVTLFGMVIEIRFLLL